MRKLVAAESTDLYAPIPHGDGQTILREALLIADHNAYHIGAIWCWCGGYLARGSSRNSARGAITASTDLVALS